VTITYHDDVDQGSEDWLNLRCGRLCASEVSKIITAKTLKFSEGKDCRIHAWELAAQRITNYVEPTYIGDAMIRGKEDEILAREAYSKEWAPVTETGFVTNDRFGFTIGYSPDGLVGDDGLIECKSRGQKYQIQTIVEWFRGDGAPVDFLLQCQTGLLVTERKWIDLVSYCGGLEMLPMRLHADKVVQDAIVEAARLFEASITGIISDYRQAQTALEMVPTERRTDQEMFI
jgi:hypothetical protein